MSCFFKSLLALLPLLFSVTVYGQKQWTLQECVNEALQKNISVRQNQVAVQQAKINMQQKKLQLLPSLNASASHNYNFGRSVDPFSNQFTTEQIQSDNASLSTNITLFNGLQLQQQLKQSKLDYLAGTYDLQKISNDISLNVVSSFLQVLYADEALTAARNQLDRSQKQRDRTRVLTEAGSLTQGNLLDAESQLATDEVNLINAENTFTIATLTLAQLLELPDVDNFKIARPETTIPDIAVLSQTPNAIYQTALSLLPEIKSSETKLISAEKSLMIAKGGRYPRLSAFGSLSSGFSSASQRIASVNYAGLLPNGSFTSTGDAILSPSYSYSYEDIPFNDQFDNNYGKSLGFSLSIPIFNGWNTETAVKRAKLGVISAELSNDLQKQQVLKSIQQAYVDAKGAQKKYEAAQRSYDALKASFNYTQKKLDAGLLSSLEWLTSKNNFSNAESELLKAKYDYIFRVKVLDFYAGKPLTL